MMENGRKGCIFQPVELRYPQCRYGVKCNRRKSCPFLHEVHHPTLGYRYPKQQCTVFRYALPNFVKNSNFQRAPHLLLRHTLEKNGFEMTFTTEEADLVWATAFPSLALLGKLKQTARILHYPGFYLLSQKQNLAKAVQAFRLLHRNRSWASQLDFLPKTFIPAGVSCDFSVQAYLCDLSA